MTKDDLINFSKDFQSEIRSEAHSVEAMREEVFVSKMGAILEEYGEIESFEPSPYKSIGIKIDGYHFDDEFKDITFIISCFKDEEDFKLTKIPSSEVDRYFKLAKSFLLRSFKKLKDEIDLSLQAHDLATLIYECKQDIRSVKIILVTDGITPKQAAEIENVNGIDITYVIWDIERAYHYCKTGDRPKIVVDFSKYCGGALPCVVRENDAPYTTYLGFVPGSALADMYGHWGIKMLDMNVRVFLSARGNVNKGIRDTIRTKPEMFCAFNNGITAFARSVHLDSTSGASGIISAEDFQIVNGGQTTASLYHTRLKDKADLSKISVQMKLTVVHNPEFIEKIVPKISEYSNTQNKVQVADLAANHPPHTEIQAVSNTTMAPDPTGGSKQTFWFYERSRGSYEELKNLTAKTELQKRQFDEMRPKNQKFDKIKFGKVWNTYLRLPHIVSFGGQKNFVRFNSWLQKQKDEDWSKFFKKTVSLLILWDWTEKMVRRQGYQGYHHNIVAYTLSWFFCLTDSRVDLDKIWASQKIGESIKDALEYLAPTVNKHIRKSQANITEFCKKEECWTGLSKQSADLPDNIELEYYSGSQQKQPSYFNADPDVADAYDYCSQYSATEWFALAKWLKERNFLTGVARSQCFNMGKALTKKPGPSVKLCIACKKVWEEAIIRGWNNSIH